MHAVHARRIKNLPEVDNALPSYDDPNSSLATLLQPIPGRAEQVGWRSEARMMSAEKGRRLELQQFAAALTVDECRWVRAIESANFGVWDLDPRLDLVHYSPQWKARLGFPRIDAPDSTSFWRCRVHPDDLDPMLGSLRAHLDGSAPSYQMRFRLRSNGSGYRTVVSRGRVVTRDNLGNATRMIGTMVDLTGWLAPVATCGLIAEEPGQAADVPRLPFHSALGVVSPSDGVSGPERAPFGGRGPDGSQEARGWIELIDDLLDIAVREGKAGR